RVGQGQGGRAEVVVDDRGVSHVVGPTGGGQGPQQVAVLQVELHQQPTAMTAWVLAPPGPSNFPVGSTPGFQPTSVPSSVTNRKTAGAVIGLPFLSSPLTMNPAVPFPS